MFIKGVLFKQLNFNPFNIVHHLNFIKNFFKNQKKSEKLLVSLLLYAGEEYH